MSSAEHATIIVKRPEDQVRPICSCGWQGTTCRNAADAKIEAGEHTSSTESDPTFEEAALLNEMPTDSTAVLEPRAVGYVVTLVADRVAELERKIAGYDAGRSNQSSRKYRAELELIALRPALEELERADRAHVDAIVAATLRSSS